VVAYNDDPFIEMRNADIAIEHLNAFVGKSVGVYLLGPMRQFGSKPELEDYYKGEPLFVKIREIIINDLIDTHKIIYIDDHSADADFYFFDHSADYYLSYSGLLDLLSQSGTGDRQIIARGPYSGKVLAMCGDDRIIFGSMEPQEAVEPDNYDLAPWITESETLDLISAHNNEKARLFNLGVQHPVECGIPVDQVNVGVQLTVLPQCHYKIRKNENETV
jgi:hypothetical protein